MTEFILPDFIPPDSEPQKPEPLLTEEELKFLLSKPQEPEPLLTESGSEPMATLTVEGLKDLIDSAEKELKKLKKETEVVIDVSASLHESLQESIYVAGEYKKSELDDPYGYPKDYQYAPSYLDDLIAPEVKDAPWLESPPINSPEKDSAVSTASVVASNLKSFSVALDGKQQCGSLFGFSEFSGQLSGHALIDDRGIMPEDIHGKTIKIEVDLIVTEAKLVQGSGIFEKDPPKLSIILKGKPSDLIGKIPIEKTSPEDKNEKKCHRFTGFMDNPKEF